MKKVLVLMAVVAMMVLGVSTAMADEILSLFSPPITKSAAEEVFSLMPEVDVISAKELTTDTYGFEIRVSDGATYYFYPPAAINYDHEKYEYTSATGYRVYSLNTLARAACMLENNKKCNVRLWTAVKEERPIRFSLQAPQLDYTIVIDVVRKTGVLLDGSSLSAIRFAIE